MFQERLKIRSGRHCQLQLFRTSYRSSDPRLLGMYFLHTITTVLSPHSDVPPANKHLSSAAVCAYSSHLRERAMGGSTSSLTNAWIMSPAAPLVVSNDQQGQNIIYLSCPASGRQQGVKSERGIQLLSFHRWQYGRTNRK